MQLFTNQQMKYSNSQWRLIIDVPRNGAWNMALDEAILESVARKENLPTLRLFTWNPFCLSLGYAQPVSDVNLSALEKNGWDLVRRPTGGRAILHAEELTYSVTAPQDEVRVKGSVLFSYQQLSRALLYALKIIGIDADSKPVENNRTDNKQNPVCFEVPSNYEITYEGKKIVGSAQARRLSGVLQHGAIPLSGDITRIIQVLNFSTEASKYIAARQLELRASTLESILKRSITWDEFAEDIIWGFQKELNMNFIASSLSKGEQDRAGDLVETKFSNDKWTNRV